MTSVKFIGQQVAKSGADLSVLPEPNDSGIWQAWEMPSGTVMMQSLDVDRHPSGPLHPLPKHVFDELFLPVAGSPNKAINASAPDLVLQWYVEALALNGVVLNNLPAGYTSEPTAPVSVTMPPPVFPPHAKPSRVAEAAAMPSSILPEAPPSPMAWPDPENMQDHIANLEQSLRQQFADITKELKTQTQIDLASYLMRLLRGTGFNHPEVHFLFTEFGLALRRDKQYELALLCHLRALEVAPEDERVLFNIARTEYELGNVDKSKEFLHKALALAPEFTVARHFLAFLDGEGA